MDRVPCHTQAPGSHSHQRSFGAGYDEAGAQNEPSLHDIIVAPSVEALLLAGESESPISLAPNLFDFHQIGNKGVRYDDRLGQHFLNRHDGRTPLDVGASVLICGPYTSANSVIDELANNVVDDWWRPA